MNNSQFFHHETPKQDLSKIAVISYSVALNNDKCSCEEWIDTVIIDEDVQCMLRRLSGYYYVVCSCM